MSVLTTLGLAKSTRNNWPVAVLVYVAHPDGDVRFWSGVGDLVYDGNTYQGCYPLGRLKGIGGSKRLTLRVVTFELSGVPTDVASALDDDIMNVAAKAWMAGLDKSGTRVNGTPFLLVDGLADYQVVRYESDGTATLELSVADSVWSIERAQKRAWTPEDINDRLADWRTDNLSGSRITGFDRMSELASATRSWTKT